MQAMKKTHHKDENGRPIYKLGGMLITEAAMKQLKTTMPNHYATIKRKGGR